MFTENEFIGFLKAKAADRWDNDRQPYLLSLVATDLKVDGNDYRPLLGEEKLKAYVKRIAEINGLQVVEHPLQLAKVGLVPSGVKFDFADAESSISQEIVRSTGVSRSTRERIVLDFLRAIGHLPDVMLDDVVIPTKVLARLLVRR